MIWAASRNSSCLHFGEYHICKEHGVKVDLPHMVDCSQIRADQSIRGYLEKIKEQNINEWALDEQVGAILSFTHL